jgi:hypothetical protein
MYESDFASMNIFYYYHIFFAVYLTRSLHSEAYRHVLLKVKMLKRSNELDESSIHKKKFVNWLCLNNNSPFFHIELNVSIKSQHLKLCQMNCLWNYLNILIYIHFI